MLDQCKKQRYGTVTLFCPLPPCPPAPYPATLYLNCYPAICYPVLPLPAPLLLFLSLLLIFVDNLPLFTPLPSSSSSSFSLSSLPIILYFLHYPLLLPTPFLYQLIISPSIPFSPFPLPPTSPLSSYLLLSNITSHPHPVTPSCPPPQASLPLPIFHSSSSLLLCHRTLLFLPFTPYPTIPPSSPNPLPPPYSPSPSCFCPQAAIVSLEIPFKRV